MFAVILAGGSGTRLWPWSREQYPKQLLKLKERSLFQETVFRLNNLVPYEDIFVVTHHDQKESLKLQFKEIAGNKEAFFLPEPYAKILHRPLA